MNVGWVHYGELDAGAPGRKGASVARGYYQFAESLRRELAAFGGFEIHDVAAGEGGHPRMFLHLVPPHLFRPVPHKHNVLFSMWEADVLPPDVQQCLRRADAHIVPTHWCRDVWRRHGLDAEVVPLGVDAAFLEAKTERPEVGPFRILTLASKIGRKGWELVAPAWSQTFGDVDNTELYVKVIGDGSVTTHYEGHVIVDQRDLSRAELIQLYESAPAFLCTSYGEGFGLIPLEAMAAGCLLLSPCHSGLTEFVSPETAIVIERRALAKAFYGVEFEIPVPLPSDIGAAMRHAFEQWKTLQDIRAEGVRVARTFTWPRAAQELHLALRRLAGERVAA